MGGGRGPSSAARRSFPKIGLPLAVNGWWPAPLLRGLRNGLDWGSAEQRRELGCGHLKHRLHSLDGDPQHFGHRFVIETLLAKSEDPGMTLREPAQRLIAVH